MSDEPEDMMAAPPPPPPPAKYDPALINRLLITAAAHAKLPGAEFITQLAEQLRLSNDAVAEAQTKTYETQNGTLRLERDLKLAHDEMRVLRAEVLDLRARVPNDNDVL